MNYILIGQKNVGKSSIFNRINKKNLNIVNSIEGSTRDWIVSCIKNNKYSFNIFDTPGLELNINKKNLEQILKSITNTYSSNIKFLLVINGKLKVRNEDKIILNWLRTFNKEIIIIINKVDNKKMTIDNNIYYELGINKIFYISCSHNLGFKELFKYFLDNTNDLDINNLNENNNNIDIDVGIFGRPNVGKSTFLNSFLGFKRFETGENPGITTDSVSEIKKFNKKIFKIHDSAGIRAKKINKNTLEQDSLKKSIKSIYKRDFSIFLIDCENFLNKQDKQLINLLSKKSKFLILVFNKFDTIKNKKIFKSNVIVEIKNLSQTKNIEYFFISAFIKNDVNKIFKFIDNQITINYNIKITTNKINQWLEKTSKNYQHPLINGKKVNFKYAILISNKPYKVKIFCNFPTKIIKSYELYLKNNFISFFKVKNQNIKFIFTSTNNPYN